MGERSAFALATALTACGVYLVPSWRVDELLDPCHVAMAASCLTIALLYLARSMGVKGAAFERIVLALFLAGMPLIYIARGGWRSHEAFGLPIYGTCAVLGLWRWPWLLATGIAAHGLGWDSWHYFGASAYIPSWYSLGCLLVDVGIGIYAAVRVAPKW